MDNTPTQPETNNTIQTQSQSPPTIISANSMGLKPQKEQHLVRKLMYGISGLLLVAVTLVLLKVFGIIGQFSAVKYNNGVGSDFNLTFYSQHSIKNSPNNILNPQLDQIERSGKVMDLVSKKSQDGKAPLEMGIVSKDLNGASQSSILALNGNCFSLNLAFTIYSNYVQKDLDVCAVTTGGKDYVYTTAFMKKNSDSQYYAVTVIQDIDSLKSASNKGSQAVQDATGLDGYRDDITKIVASITPVN